MKCVFFIISICVIAQIINGQDDLESDDNRNGYGGSDGSEADKDKFNEPEKEFDVYDDEGGVSYQKNSEEKLSKKKIAANVEYEEPSWSRSLEAKNVVINDDNTNDPENRQKEELFNDTVKRFLTEMAAGDTADLIANNEHIHQPYFYKDLGRRFVPQYKYTEAVQTTAPEPEENGPIPEEAPAELVLVVAKESALLGSEKPADPADEIDRKQILRTGDYWNGVWKEEVNPKNTLRAAANKKILAVQTTAPEPEENGPIPEEAPPELVLVVAKESALLGSEKPADPADEIDRKQILRTGDYWNGVWKEEVNPKNTLRAAANKKILGSITAKIKPGSEFYKIVSRMKKISPRLLYIINKKHV